MIDLSPTHLGCQAKQLLTVMSKYQKITINAIQIQQKFHLLWKYFNHSEVYDGIKICSQLHFFIYESINTCKHVETLCLHTDFVFFSISKLQNRNSDSYFFKNKQYF